MLIISLQSYIVSQRKERLLKNHNNINPFFEGSNYRKKIFASSKKQLYCQKICDLIFFKIYVLLEKSSLFEEIDK